MKVSHRDSMPSMIVIETTTCQYIIMRFNRSNKALKKNRKQNLAANITNHEISVQASSTCIVETISPSSLEIGKGSDTLSLKFSSSNK